MNIYLSDPLPSLPPKYLPSWSPIESLLCSSDGKCWLHTRSIGSDLTLSFMRFGGDGVRLSLSVDDADKPFPFDAFLLLKLVGSESEFFTMNISFSFERNMQNCNENKGYSLSVE